MSEVEFNNSSRIEMPFGKHQGKPVCELPYDYLVWLYNEVDLDSDLLATVENTLNERWEEFNLG